MFQKTVVTSWLRNHVCDHVFVEPHVAKFGMPCCAKLWSPIDFIQIRIAPIFLHIPNPNCVVSCRMSRASSSASLCQAGFVTQGSVIFLCTGLRLHLALLFRISDFLHLLPRARCCSHAAWLHIMALCIALDAELRTCRHPKVGVRAFFLPPVSPRTIDTASRAENSCLFPQRPARNSARDRYFS